MAKESNYALIEDIVKELVDIFPSEYIHIGGDEVKFSWWQPCPDCQRVMREKGLENGAQLEQHFINRVSDILAKYNRKLDFVSLDCTGMMLENYRHGHMGLSVDAEVVERLREMGLCDDKTVVYVNHFSHNGKATHEELVKEAAKYGFGVTFDGCEIEF